MTGTCYPQMTQVDADGQGQAGAEFNPVPVLLFSVNLPMRYDMEIWDSHKLRAIPNIDIK